MKPMSYGKIALSLLALGLGSCDSPTEAGRGNAGPETTTSLQTANAQKPKAYCNNPAICDTILEAHRIKTTQEFNRMVNTYFDDLGLVTDEFLVIPVAIIDSALNSGIDMQSHYIKLGPLNPKDTTDNNAITLRFPPKENKMVEAYYNLALFQKILDVYGKDKIEAFHFSYARDLAKHRNTILFKVIPSGGNGQPIYLGDYSDEPPRKSTH